jgi:hypothetical protein
VCVASPVVDLTFIAPGVVKHWRDQYKHDEKLKKRVDGLSGQLNATLQQDRSAVGWGATPNPEQA